MSYTECPEPWFSHLWNGDKNKPSLFPGAPLFCIIFLSISTITLICTPLSQVSIPGKTQEIINFLFIHPTVTYWIPAMCQALCSVLEIKEEPGSGPFLYGWQLCKPTGRRTEVWTCRVGQKKAGDRGSYPRHDGKPSKCPKEGVIGSDLHSRDISRLLWEGWAGNPFLVEKKGKEATQMKAKFRAGVTGWPSLSVDTSDKPPVLLSVMCAQMCACTCVYLWNRDATEFSWGRSAFETINHVAWIGSWRPDWSHKSVSHQDRDIGGSMRVGKTN